MEGPNGLLATLTYEQFWGWMEFNRLNPFLEERADFHAASIVSMVHNVNVIEKEDLKSPKDFMLPTMEENLEREEKERQDKKEKEQNAEDQKAAWGMFIGRLTAGRKPVQTVFKG